MEFSGTVYRLFLDFKKAYISIRREVLYNILNEFEITRKVDGLVNLCVNETCNRVRIGRYQSEKFPFQNGLKQETFNCHFSTLLYNTPLRGSKRKRKG
jgi:hypothetical protein